MITTVIFDMDGTLIDSERLGQRAWRMAAESMGKHVTQEMLDSLIGLSRADVIKLSGVVMGDPELGEQMFWRSREYRAQITKTELEVKPGVFEAIEALRDRGVRCAVGTSTMRSIVEPMLEHVGLLPLFEIVTCGDDVANGKPAPDIFLLAAQRMGEDPSRCACVEDSPNGVRAGHAAGMPVFLVPDLIEPTDEIASRCVAVLSTMHELDGAIREYDERG